MSSAESFFERKSKNTRGPVGLEDGGLQVVIGHPAIDNAAEEILFRCAEAATGGELPEPSPATASTN